MSSICNGIPIGTNLLQTMKAKNQQRMNIDPTCHKLALVAKEILTLGTALPQH